MTLKTTYLPALLISVFAACHNSPETECYTPIENKKYYVIDGETGQITDEEIITDCIDYPFAQVEEFDDSVAIINFREKDKMDTTTFKNVNDTIHFQYTYFKGSRERIVSIDKGDTSIIIIYEQVSRQSKEYLSKVIFNDTNYTWHRSYDFDGKEYPVDLKTISHKNIEALHSNVPKK